MVNIFQIVTFYAFKDMNEVGTLTDIKDSIKTAMRQHAVFGTMILAEEGFNASLCGARQDIPDFIEGVERILNTKIEYKSSYHPASPFRKHEVKIKPEIVTLKQKVNISGGQGTHVLPEDWNGLISDPNVFVLDARNDYEFKNGSFKSAVNPKTEKFSQLPNYVAEELDPKTHTKIAMYCTGGIRCEKFAPYMKSLGFAEVYQLKGGILKYLEDVPKVEQLWEGECFVFDERRTLTDQLNQGTGPDYSLRHSNKKR